MSYDKTIFMPQYCIVHDFVQHVAYARGMKAEVDKGKIGLALLARACDSLLMVAILNWCKVFGTDGPNPTHWKRTSTLKLDAVNDQFRKKIFARTGLSELEWLAYHQAMCDFRSKYVAQHEIGSIPPVPPCDNALRVAFAYDEWIRDLIAPDFIESPPLETFYSRWFEEAQSMMSTIGKRLAK
jgi:hypothetical protein